MKRVLLCLFAFIFITDSFANGIGVLDTSAPCTNNTLSNYNGTVNAEIDWQPNTINVTWFDGNTQLDVPDAAKTCTYDGTLTVPAAPPERLGYTFNGWKVMGVPNGYTKLEYLQFNGAQWIDTGIVPNQDSRVRVTAMPTNENNCSAFICGSYGGTGWADKTFGVYFTCTNARLYFNYNSDTLIQDSNGQDVIRKINTKYYFEINKNKFYVNENLVGSAPVATFTANETLLIGRQNLDWQYGQRYLIGRIYDFAMWDNGRLVRSMIPAKNPSNVLGMYDTVSGTFFTNAGSGSFTAGPAVQ